MLAKEFILGVLVGLAIAGLGYALRVLWARRSPLAFAATREKSPSRNMPPQGKERELQSLPFPMHADAAIPLELALQQAPVGYLHVDRDNRLLWCNRRACELLGITGSDRQKLKGRMLLQLVRSYELDRLIARARLEAGTESPIASEWVFHPVTLDPWHPVEERDRPLRGYALLLPAQGVGIYLEDRTETTVLQQQRDRWASDVAHELKTPLTSIRLLVETLQSRVDRGTRPWIDRLLNEVLRLSNLVQDLLDLAQFETGSPPQLATTAIDLPCLVKSAWDSLEPLASRKQLRLDYTGPVHLLVRGDESRLFRVVLNLLDNAIKYSPPQQVIRVAIAREEASSASDTGAAICLDTIDCGHGFEEEALPYLFDRFYRADRSRSRLQGDGGGTGLGLAIVKQIVQLHGGTVTASNHPETGGAWVRVRLPDVQPADSMSSPRA